jgi:hypothetical protein
MGLDILTGTIQATYNGVFTSKRYKYGLLLKVVFLVFNILLFLFFDLVAIILDVKLGITFNNHTIPISVMITLLFMRAEYTSIINENLPKLGVTHIRDIQQVIIDLYKKKGNRNIKEKDDNNNNV